jgi:hypothetical protein
MLILDVIKFLKDRCKNRSKSFYDISFFILNMMDLKCGVGEGWRRSVGPIM